MLKVFSLLLIFISQTFGSKLLVSNVALQYNYLVFLAYIVVGYF